MTDAVDATIAVRFMMDVETVTAAARARRPRRRCPAGRRIALVKYCLLVALGSVIVLTVTAAYLAWTEREWPWFGALGWSAFAWWLIVKLWRNARSRGAVRGALAEWGLLDTIVVVTASPADGLRWETRRGIMEIPWAGVTGWRESPRMFMIADCDGFARFVPTAAFPSPAALGAFRHLLQTHAG